MNKLIHFVDKKTRLILTIFSNKKRQAQLSLTIFSNKKNDRHSYPLPFSAIKKQNRIVKEHYFLDF